MKKILVLNGPNLNLLGKREPAIYGHVTLSELSEQWMELGAQKGVEVVCLQSNIEGELVDAIQEYGFDALGIVFNPGGYTHTSVAIRDAIAAVPAPVYEVHISHPEAREEFRKQSLIRSVCVASVSGLGTDGYAAALNGILKAI